VQQALEIGQSARAHLWAAVEREDQICRSLIRSSTPRLLYPRDALCDQDMGSRLRERMRKSMPQVRGRRTVGSCYFFVLSLSNHSFYINKTILLLWQGARSHSQCVPQAKKRRAKRSKSPGKRPLAGSMNSQKSSIY